MGDCNNEFADWNVQTNGDVYDFTGSCFVIGETDIRQVNCKKPHMKLDKYNGLYKVNKKVTRCLSIDGDLQFQWNKCNLSHGMYRLCVFNLLNKIS